MARVCKRASVTDGKFTNHSVRRTMCTQLYQRGVPPVMIAQLSGHKNIDSLSHYTVASARQQQEMCRILQNPAQHPSAATSNLHSAPTITPQPREGVSHVDSKMSASPATSVTLSIPATCSAQPREAQPPATTQGNFATVSNTLDQSMGLRGFLSNAQFHGHVTFNININHL